MTTGASAHGETVDSLAAGVREYHLGNSADGYGLWLANVDAANGLIVEVLGSVVGDRTYNLTGKGDWCVIPAGDVTLVRVSASAYPCAFGWAYLIPHMVIGSGQKR